jgi:homoserine kinase type II
MAAFTQISRMSLENYLAVFDIGDLVSFDPITTGIENSNYFVTLNHHDYETEFVLTIAESLDFNEVSFFGRLLDQLNKKGLPVPSPLRTLDGMSSTILLGKPTWLFPKLSGTHPTVASANHCGIIGKLLADIHDASTTANYHRDNPYHDEWSWETLKGKKDELDHADYSMLEETLTLYAKTLSHPLDLPRGIIHGDLFMDNTMFEGDKLTGVIDFYHACEDYLIQDVSIALLVWCTDADGVVNQNLSQSLLTGYESVRSFTKDERNMLPVFCRSAASRFALTRLISGEGQGYLKDPQEFLNILRLLE